MSEKAGLVWLGLFLCASILEGKIYPETGCAGALSFVYNNEILKRQP